MDYEKLKIRQRSEREGYPANLALRVHRALSWLRRAEELGRQDDLDGQFVFLWIAFNAAYAVEIDERYRKPAQETLQAFLKKLAALDGDHRRLDALVWDEFSGPIRTLLANEYVYQEFWAYQNGVLTQAQWKAAFATARRAATRALSKHDTVRVLAIVLARVYTLRNQLIHGGATWASAVNREQVRDCTRFMAKLVPLVIEIMMDHPGTLWGDPTYPVVGQ